MENDGKTFVILVHRVTEIIIYLYKTGFTKFYKITIHLLKSKFLLQNCCDCLSVFFFFLYRVSCVGRQIYCFHSNFYYNFSTIKLDKKHCKDKHNFSVNFTISFSSCVQKFSCKSLRYKQKYSRKGRSILTEIEKLNAKISLFEINLSG